MMNKQKMVPTKLYLPVKLKTQLKGFAALRGTTMSALVESIIVSYMANITEMRKYQRQTAVRMAEAMSQADGERDQTDLRRREQEILDPPANPTPEPETPYLEPEDEDENGPSLTEALNRRPRR